MFQVENADKDILIMSDELNDRIDITQLYDERKALYRCKLKFQSGELSGTLLSMSSDDKIKNYQIESKTSDDIFSLGALKEITVYHKDGSEVSLEKVSKIEELRMSFSDSTTCVIDVTFLH